MLPVLLLAALSGYAIAAVFVGGLLLLVVTRAIEDGTSEPLDCIDPATVRPLIGRSGVSLPPQLDPTTTNHCGPL